MREGGELVGGILHRVPPHSPLDVVLEALPRELSRELKTIVREHRLESPVAIEAFSDRARWAVTRYRRKQLHK